MSQSNNAHCDNCGANDHRATNNVDNDEANDRFTKRPEDRSNQTCGANDHRATNNVDNDEANDRFTRRPEYRSNQYVNRKKFL